MKAKIIAAVVLAMVAGSAMAGGDGDEELKVFSDTSITNTAKVTTTLTFKGHGKVKGEAKANVGNEQSAGRNNINPSEYGGIDPSATVDGNALKGAQGNIGVNVAAGVGNNQSNDVALAAIDAKKVFAAATSVSHQDTNYNSESDTSNRATLDGNALEDAKGNIGVNVAAGVGNNQENGLAASVNKHGVLAMATTTNDQTSYANSETGVCDTAKLSGNALMGAQGNIGVNIAAGVGNNQHNSLAIAVATK